MRSILVFLARKKKSNDSPALSGYTKLREILGLHTSTVDRPFADDILELLRAGGIVIVDLSQGDPNVQRLYSEQICTRLFIDAMRRCVSQSPNNFLQFYFEEAHNLFPKKDDQDLSQIYNRIPFPPRALWKNSRQSGVADIQGVSGRVHDNSPPGPVQ